MDLLALVLLVQGGGGLINNLSGGSKSWFLLNYVQMPTALHITGHALLLTIGLVIGARRMGWSRLKGDR